MEKRFAIQFDELPVSVNNYLKPSAVVKGGKAFVHMYESTEAKNFKKRFGAYLKREVKKQGWDKEWTKSGHWVLECVFVQARTNQDSNNYFKILCDSLTGIVTIDDKNVLVQTKKVLYDAKSPRFFAVLKPVEYRGVWKDEEHYAQFFEHNCMICKKNHETCTILRKANEYRVVEEIKQEHMFNVCEKRKS